MSLQQDPQTILKEFKAKHKFFVGIDSDGCVFDTMEIKHKECFIPNIIKHWHLQAISKYARESGEFVNLYSKWRGINRFPALTMVFDLLEEREEVKKRGVKIPKAASLRKWIEEETKLGNPALQAKVEKDSDEVLLQALKWSKAVNQTVAEMVEGVPPFPFVRESLEKLNNYADIIVVSATPTEALQKEWTEHNVDQYPFIIAGQELGNKKELLSLTTKNQYEKDHVLMIGDAPGDFKAAKANNALFFPINPGQEDMSWERFYKEGLDKFLNGTFVGKYEADLIEEFEALLPSVPAWKK